jgi:hypothetical protein
MILVLMNLIPVIGAFELDWSVKEVIVLYWFENLVVGFYTLAKIIIHPPDSAPMDNSKVPKGMGQFGKVFMIGFFTVHFGMFCAGHATFLQSFLFGGFSGFSGLTDPLFNLAEAVLSSNLVWAAIGLFASHGFSFVFNYIRKKEYTQIPMAKVMFQPYPRIIVMHITVMAIGFIIFFNDGNSPLLILPLVGVKTLVDMRMHVSRHKDPGKIRFF